MTQQEIRIHPLANGMVLVAEPMPWLESAAFALLVPAGYSRDPRPQAGLANLTCDMVQRGCGDRDAREFVEALELLGVEGSQWVSVAHTAFANAMPAEHLLPAISIFADVVQRPLLPEDQLEDSRLVCMQEIRALDDDLVQRVMWELRRRQYPDPYGRPTYGTMESVASIGLADTRRHIQQHYRPGGTILSVAGRVDWEALRDHVEEHFGGWQPAEPPALDEVPPEGGYLHLPHESSQTHIAVSYPSVPYSHEDYFQARGAVGVLSDGMSSRLFTEIREKRGLCYSVSASCHSLRGRGSVICYAGTTTERAQETLDVLIGELRRLAGGVEQEELDRLKVKIKSSLIMQQESSTSRSGSIATDWYYLERVRSLAEIGAIVDRLTCDSINRYLAAHPPGHFTVVTLGQQALEMPDGVS